VGNGLAEVGLLAVLTIIVLPCCLFTLLALLDRFERNLDPGAQTPPQPATATAILAEAQDPAHDDDDAVSADVVSLPIPIAVAEAPAAATG
jgi:hypothetical protein